MHLIDDLLEHGRGAAAVDLELHGGAFLEAEFLYHNNDTELLMERQSGS
jgi:hypothetical protein